MNSPTNSVSQVLMRVIGPGLIFALLLVPWILLAGQLPDPIAVHWGITGRPNGHAPWWLWTLLSTLLWCVGWAALVRRTGTRLRWSLANIYALGGVLLAGEGVLLWANFGKGTWEAARQLPAYGISIPVVLIATLAFVAISWLLAGSAQPSPTGAGPSLGLGPTERAVWAGSADNRWLLALAPIAAAAAILVDGRNSLILIGVLLVIALGFSHISVMVGSTGVTTRLGLLGWPRRHLALTQIKSARGIAVAAIEYGGWGWRRRPGLSAVIVRGGAALELELQTGGRFVVTVDGATQAAGLVNDLLRGELASPERECASSSVPRRS